MVPYSLLNDQNIPGETPREKYENLIAMKNLLSSIAYPRRGTAEETMTIQEAADLIMERFSRDDLEEVDL